MDPVYTPPVGLEGYVTRPLSEIELPSDSNGHFEWQTDPATTLPTQEEAQAAVRYVPNDTENYNIV